MLHRIIGSRALKLRVGLAQHSRGLQSLPLINVNSGRDELLKYFNNIGSAERLYDGLANEAIISPTNETPFVFYTAHSAALYDNKFHQAGLIKEKVNSEFASLFEAGVDEMSWDNLHDHDPSVWPAFEKVQEYREQVHSMVTDIIEHHPCLDGERNMENEQFWAVVMGFEHDKIHMETSSVLIREMPLSKVKEPKGCLSLMILNTRRAKHPGSRYAVKTIQPTTILLESSQLQ